MALLFRSTVDSAARWRAQLTRLTQELEVRVWPEIGNPAEIDYALVWRPEPGFLASLPNLKLILSLGAGVDHLLGDPQLPRHVPIVRLVDPHMTDAMSEYVVLQVLRLHRRDLDYRAQQEAGVWRELDQQNAAERRVGILGLGELGQDAAKKLTALGFDVAGWSRSEKNIAGIASYAGAAGLAPLLGRSEILVCLLPLTAETEGILNASTLALLPKGAALVNAARGAHLVEDDLLAGARLGAGLGCSARRLSRGAATCRSSILAPPARDRDTARRRFHQPHDRRPDHPRQYPPLRGRPPTAQPDRSGARLLTACGS